MLQEILLFNADYIVCDKRGLKKLGAIPLVCLILQFGKPEKLAIIYGYHKA